MCKYWINSLISFCFIWLYQLLLTMSLCFTQLHWFIYTIIQVTNTVCLFTNIHIPSSSLSSLSICSTSLAMLFFSSGLKNIRGLTSSSILPLGVLVLLLGPGMASSAGQWQFTDALITVLFVSKFTLIN